MGLVFGLVGLALVGLGAVMLTLWWMSRDESMTKRVSWWPVILAVLLIAVGIFLAVGIDRL